MRSAIPRREMDEGGVAVVRRVCGQNSCAAAVLYGMILVSKGIVPKRTVLCDRYRFYFHSCVI